MAYLTFFTGSMASNEVKSNTLYIYINVHEQTFCYIIIITEVFVGEYADEFQPKIQKSSMCILC